jgi:hypothetical protein
MRKALISTSATPKAVAAPVLASFQSKPSPFTVTTSGVFTMPGPWIPALSSGRVETVEVHARLCLVGSLSLAEPRRELRQERDRHPGLLLEQLHEWTPVELHRMQVGRCDD